jgi:hypothetical protein
MTGLFRFGYGSRAPVSASYRKRPGGSAGAGMDVASWPLGAFGDKCTGDG